MKKQQIVQRTEHDVILDIQNTLGQLGFTYTGHDKFYKDYAIEDGVSIRIIPNFSSVDSVEPLKLVSFSAVTIKTIPVVDGMPVKLDQFQTECIEDVNRIVNNLAPLSKQAMQESFMITMTCSMCGEEVVSYMHIHGAYTCMKCLGYE